jgi:hypothetical protein
VTQPGGSLYFAARKIFLRQSFTVADEVGVGFGFRTQRRLKDGTKRAVDESEHRRIRAARLPPHQIAPVPQYCGNRLECAPCQKGSLRVSVAARPLGVEPAANPAPDHRFDKRPDGHWHGFQQARGSALEITAFDPAGMHHQPIKLIVPLASNGDNGAISLWRLEILFTEAT